MAIKLIVTDLDGTFYHRDVTYDVERFKRLYGKMEEEGIRFVIASGNQYYQLISFFDNHDEMTFIAENGGYVVEKGKEIFSVSIKKESWHKVVNYLEGLEVVDVLIICGKKSAYVLPSMPDEVMKEFSQYFPMIRKVEDINTIDDQIIKIALMSEESAVDALVKDINELIDEELATVTSGHGCIDVVVKDVHKGHALELLMKKWNIRREEIMAFGDAMNDYEMLKTAGYGFVMANAKPQLKEQFKNITEFSNEEDGELVVLDEYFSDREAFLEKYR